MSRTGQCYKLEQTFRVTEAVVNEGKSISLDWEESDCKGHLHAIKADGGLYRGTWGYPGYPGHDPAGEVEAAVFRASEGAILLYGKWWGRDYPEEGFII